MYNVFKLDYMPVQSAVNRKSEVLIKNQK